MTAITTEMDEAPFADRRDAGRELARELGTIAGERPVVVALPRGGVPVGRAIADRLGAPLEILAVRKLSTHHNPEFGIGAIAEDGTCVVDPEAIAVMRVLNGELEGIVQHATAELLRRVNVYRGPQEPLDLRGRNVIVVDDGVATGITDTAALRAVQHQEPRRVVLAVPVCAPEAVERLRSEADEIVCLRVPRVLRGVSHWYRDFSQVSDEEVFNDLEPRPDAVP